MKFLHLFPFYDQYLTDFYRTRPELVSAPVSQQIEELLVDSFSGAHMVAPYMPAFGYESYFVPINAYPAQMQWAKENGITSFDRANWKADILRRQIETIKPDILYTNDPIRYDGRFMRSLSWRPKLIMGWHASVIPQGIDWDGYDVIVSNVPAWTTKAVELGAKAVEFNMPGFPGHVAEALKNQQKEFDVVFTGLIDPFLHATRQETLMEVGKAPLGPRPPFSISYFLTANKEALPLGISMYDRGSVWGLAMHQAIKCGKIVLNPIGNPLGETKDLVNVRDFEITGTGSFMLTNHHDAICQYFTPGKEIETYRDNHELIEKIYYYLDHEKEREDIARRGQERCLREHSMERRAERLDEIIRTHLKKKGVAVSAQPAKAAAPAATYPDVATAKAPISPFTGSDQVVHEGDIPTAPLIASYRRHFGIDVASYFAGLPTIGIYRCLTTGYRFYFPFALEGSGEFYEALQQFDWYYMDWKWEHQIASDLIADGAKVLEIGCGRGGFLDNLRKRGINGDGLEYNEAAVAGARARGLNVVRQSIQDYSRSHQESYDAVCSFQVVEHVAAVGEFIEAAVACVKPGGKVVLSTPYHDAAMIRLDDEQPLNRPPHHLGLWDINAMVGLTKLYPLALDGIELEPLQPYHVEHSVGLVKRRLVAERGQEGLALLRQHEPAVAAVAELVLRQVPGHTLLAHFTKV